jgi:orotidine-5'-phosphate decarboxylase
MTFTQRLRKVQHKTQSLLCVGLDTDPALLPRGLSGMPDGVVSFNRAIIDATRDLVCAYKLNLAFYEAMGEYGWHAMRETLAYIGEGVLTIGDGKRGDIGNTADQYASALFDDLRFDAVTLNPYMGRDSVEPFLAYPGRGVFLLALTSNPGSKDFQRLKVGSKRLYERVVHAAAGWNMKKNIGLVVGATHPRELKHVRSLAPSMPLLIPGVGKQGGDLRSAIRYGCDAEGGLAVINVGRSVLYASQEANFAEAAREEAAMLRNEIEVYRKQFFS